MLRRRPRAWPIPSLGDAAVADLDRPCGSGNVLAFPGRSNGRPVFSLALEGPLVRLSELVHPEFVHLGVDADTKEQLMERLVDRLVDEGKVEDRGSMLRSLVERERVMSTGIGRGVAIPHAQSVGARTLTVSIARPSRPLDFGSVDHEPVRLVFLVTGPEERGGFIRVLARISRLLCSSDLQARVLGAVDAADVVKALTEEEDTLS